MQNNYIYRGISYSLSPEYVEDAKECYGIDVEHAVNKAIDHILKTSTNAIEKNSVSKIRITMHDEDAHDGNECVFQFHVILA